LYGLLFFVHYSMKRSDSFLSNTNDCYRMYVLISIPLKIQPNNQDERTFIELRLLNEQFYVYSVVMLALRGRGFTLKYLKI